MPAVPLRRALGGVAAAAVTIAVAPMATALAAPAAFAASSITTNPAPDSSSVVHANRPQVVATFNAKPASGSISLTIDGGSQNNLCGTAVIDTTKNTVTCTPTADLDPANTYDAVGTATNASGAKATTSTLKFTVDYPVIQPDKSAPAPNGALVDPSEDIKAVFNEAVSATTGASSGSGATCADVSKCSLVLYEVFPDGSRGSRIDGSLSLASSGNPVNGPKDTLDFDPTNNLVNNDVYEAVVHVTGAGQPAAHGDADYKVFITAGPPYNLSAPAFANNVNDSAFPLSGYAAPGLTVNVAVPNNNFSDPTHQSDAKGSTVVKECPSAPNCPWTATVDLSNFNDSKTPGDLSWTASATDGGGKSTGSATGPTFTKDTTAPDTPKCCNSTNGGTASETDDTTTHTASVTFSGATEDETQSQNKDITTYVVTVTDDAKNAVTKQFPADPTTKDLPATTVDVSSLDDGNLTLVVQAMDAIGNVSAECTSTNPPSPPTPATQRCSDATLQKKAGLAPSLDQSVITSNSGDTTFTKAETQSVQSPSRISVGFTQTIRESYTDFGSSGQQTHHSSICIASANGNCIVNGTPKVSSDNHSLSMDVPSALADGTYEVHVQTYSQSQTACPDETPQNAPTYKGCPGQYNDLVRLPGTGSPGTPFQFTVNSTPPAVTITSLTNPVTAANEKNVTVSGTVSAGATVSLLFTSSGSATQKQFASATVAPPGQGATTTTWQAGPVDLSSLPDGTLTVTATAKLPNGTTASATRTASMQAHASTLTERTNHTVVTANRAIKISGHLLDETGNPIAKAVVSITPRFDGGSTGHSVAAVTDSNGNYAATFVPQHNATYTATYKGSPNNDGARVSTARTLVRAAVTLTGKAHQSAPVTVSGSVAPNKHGRTVTIYELTSSGKKVVGKATLNGKSRFTAKVAVARGKVRLIATIAKSPGNVAGKSGVLVVQVG